jgi:2-iminobutanoate/2-iminopropanoate deaminase
MVSDSHLVPRLLGANQLPGATWSSGLVIGDDVVLSGITAPGETLHAQTVAVFARMADLLAEAGGSLRNVTKLVIYVTDMAGKAEINRARAACFGPLFPCSTLLQVGGFAFPHLQVEIDAWANLAVDMHAAAARG